MNVLSEKEKEMIARLRDPLYTVEFIEEWINRDDRVMINPVAAMQAVGAKAFLQAVKCMIRTCDWIPVDERTPDSDEYILLSFSNFSLPMVGRFEDGAFYLGDEDDTCVSQDLFVNAWRPLPAPYRPEE